jgi:neogenin
MISELKPSTQYEFEVKVVKGKRESSWSMSVLNSTMSAAPASPPRDLKANILDEKSPLSVHLSWSPPKHATPITNYVILYTTDSEKRDREWSYEYVPADKTSVIISPLQSQTTYYFKVQSKHGKSIFGPFSAMVSVKTGAPVVSTNDTVTASNILLTTEIFYALIGGIILLVLIIIVVIAMIFCRKKPQETPEHKKSYQKNPQGVIKPPDLWIHHDQMELKNIEKTTLHPATTPGCSDAASSSGHSMTLPRSVGHEFEGDGQFPGHVTNSLDKRTYVPGYMSKI